MKNSSIYENMTAKARLYLYIVLTILLMGLIFFHSALPADLSQTESDFLSDFLVRLFHWEPDTASFVVRKAAHFLEYAILGILLTLIVNEVRGQNAIRWVVVVLPWAIGTFYALTDEFHQLFVEGRSCELRDIAIDSAGVLLGVMIVLIVRCLKKRKIRGVEV